MCQIIVFQVIIICIISSVAGTEYFVILTSNSPVVQGAEVTFNAQLYTTTGQIPSGTFEYVWFDNGIPRHERNMKVESAEDKWSVSYPADEYPPGPYEMQVSVYHCWVFCYSVTSKRIDFNITSKLNGRMNLIQDNTVITRQFVSNATVVQHEIALSPPDYIYLKDNATSLLTYWFVDCIYYGMTTNLTFAFKYDKPESEHLVEALVVAGFDPITTPAPSTTTTTSTTTVKPNITTTTVTTTTTQKPITTTTTFKPNTTIPRLDNAIHREIAKREVNYTEIMMSKNGSPVPIGDNSSFPFVCLNQSNISPDPKKTYGYFSRKMIVKAPVNISTVTGNNWLQHGDLLTLSVACTGSPPFSYCLNFRSGHVNTTGNETCDFQPLPLDNATCHFTISHYYNHPGENTIQIVIRNDVARTVYPVTVNVYKVTKRPQLSVIVVPVSFSLVAVVLIVFGVAYYIQNRRRFTVEVADFDFGQTYNDLEYKTFRERLRDSVTNALTRTHGNGTEPPEQSASMWPPTSRKYGSMT